jgi:YfiH family protein
MDKNKNLISYRIFDGFDELVAFTTTKKTLPTENIRYSEAPENRARLAGLLGISVTQLVFPDQTHTNCVVEITETPVSPISETDALVTNVAGMCLCVQTADCVPVLLYDPVEKVVSAVHAGWRGTVGKIVEVAVEKMIRGYGSQAENILAAIGPSICQDVYEVGLEVVEAAKNTVPNVSEALHLNDSGNFQFNLWEANRQFLLKCGLQEKNIQVLGECTFSEEERYYSARREGISTGRMVSGIMIKL